MADQPELPDWFRKMAHYRKHIGSLSYDQLDRLMKEFEALWAAVEDLKQENGEVLYRIDYEYDGDRLICGDGRYDARMLPKIWPYATEGRWHETLRRIHLVAVQSKIVRTLERPADA